MLGGEGVGCQVGARKATGLRVAQSGGFPYNAAPCQNSRFACFGGMFRSKVRYTTQAPYFKAFQSDSDAASCRPMSISDDNLEHLYVRSYCKWW